jgi:hypothetical protein
MLAAIVLAAGSLAFVVASMVRSIKAERTPGTSIWREFSLGLALLVLFLATWGGHAIAEWQTYTDEQRQLGQDTEAGDFVAQFAQATLENWQSEFLQLFAFVSLAALYVHKGSAESRDSDDRMEASLRRIEERLGSLPPETSSEASPARLPAPSTS